MSSVFSIYATSPVVAQTPEASSTTTSPGLPTVEITSPQDGQQVPPGAFTIQGISSDDEETDCLVYADANDVTPMRNVTAAGDSEEDNDFSKWTFTYAQDYQLIKPGENELTAKISCYDIGESDLNPFPAGADTTSSSPPLSEWHTVNVTAVQGAAVPSPSPSPSPTSTEEASDDDEESEEESSGDTGVDDDGSNDDGTGGAGGNSNNGLFGGDSFFD